jgi:hypothetical protein
LQAVLLRARQGERGERRGRRRRREGVTREVGGGGGGGGGGEVTSVSVMMLAPRPATKTFCFLARSASPAADAASLSRFSRAFLI